MTIPAGRFKAECLKLMDHVEQTRQQILITKRGRPVAQMVPVEERQKPQLFGRLKGLAVLAESALE